MIVLIILQFQFSKSNNIKNQFLLMLLSLIIFLFPFLFFLGISQTIQLQFIPHNLSKLLNLYLQSIIFNLFTNIQMKYSIASIKNHQNRTTNTSTPNTQHNQSFSLFYQIENTINFSISDSSKQKATLEQIKLDELEIQQKSLKLKNKFQRLLSSSAFRRKVTSQIPIKNKSLVNNGFRRVCYEYRRKSQQKKIYLRIIEEILSQSTHSNIAELLFSVHNKQILKQKKEQETSFHKVANGQLKNNKQQNMFEKVQDKKLKNILIITPKQIY